MNTVPSAETDVCVEGRSAGASSWADGGGALGGVLDYGTIEEDGPVTWETLISPARTLDWGTRAEHPNASCASGGVHGRHGCQAAARHRTSTRAQVGRVTRDKPTAAAEGDEGVGGPNKSDDVGERLAPGPGRAKAARVGMNFGRATWPTRRRR
jgi:hypothetical protein